MSLCILDITNKRYIITMKRFRKVYVEITNICNKHCSFCPNTSRAKAFMSVKDFETIAKEISEYTDYIYLHVKGEPLLHQRLDEILDICNEYNLKVNISTNGVLLKQNESILLDKKIRQLNVSLHSFEDSNLEKLKKYVDEVLSVCDALAKSGVIIRLKLWNSNKEKENENNKYIITKLSDMYNIEIIEQVFEKDKKLADNIFLSIRTPFVWPKINNEKVIHNTCYGLRNQVAILVDGTVVPCCVDNNADIPLGNILKTSLKDILETSKVKNIIKGFEDNKCIENLCKSCEYKNIRK